MTKNVYTPDEMPNESYHNNDDGPLADHVNGTVLSKIFHQSLAHWKYGEEENTQPLDFGIASHAAILEPEKFDDEFVRGISPDEFPETLKSDAAIKSKLKSLGITGYTQFSGTELIIFADETVGVQGCSTLPDTSDDDMLDIWRVRYGCFVANNIGKTIVPPDGYDEIMQMRNSIQANKKITESLTGGLVEHTFTAEIRGVKVKVRPDIKTMLDGLWDYKTTISCHPQEFPRKAFYLGYYLKMALQHDVVCASLDTEMPNPVLLAQEKKKPYVCKPYRLSDEQMSIGREQYKRALNLYQKAKEKGVYPAYGNSVDTMMTPDYILREYNLL